MALIKCPQCGKRMSSYAERCPQCGCEIHEYSNENYEEETTYPDYSLNLPQVMPLNPEENRLANPVVNDMKINTQKVKNNESKGGEIGCAIIFAIIAILLILIFSSSSNSSNESILSSSASDQKVYAWIAAKDIVEQNLKSPSTAKFCNYSDATIKYVGVDKYQVSGYVDAQNGFGATIRSNFVATLTLTDSGYEHGTCVIQ